KAAVAHIFEAALNAAPFAVGKNKRSAFDLLFRHKSGIAQHECDVIFAPKALGCLDSPANESQPPARETPTSLEPRAGRIVARRCGASSHSGQHTGRIVVGTKLTTLTGIAAAGIIASVGFAAGAQAATQDTA